MVFLKKLIKLFMLGIEPNLTDSQSVVLPLHYTNNKFILFIKKVLRKKYNVLKNTGKNVI